MSIRVNVVMGGPSARARDFLLSGHTVLKNISRRRYVPRAVVITMEQEFYVCDAAKSIPSEDELAGSCQEQAF